MKDLLSFNWDEDPITEFVKKDDEEFLQKEDGDIKKPIEEEEAPEKEEIVVEDTKKEDEPIKEEPEEEEEDDESFIKESDIEEEEEDSKEFSSLTKKLKDSGIIDLDVDENEIKDENDFLALQEKEINKRVEKSLKTFSDELGDEGKLFIKYVKDGGKPKAFFEILKDSTSIPLYNEDDERENEEVIRYYLKNIKDITDEEDIEETIETLKEKEKFTKYAKKYSESLSEIKKKKEENELLKQKQFKKDNEETKKQFEKGIETYLSENDNINGLKISDQEKDVIKQYIFNPVKKTGNTYISKFSSDLQEVFNDPSKIVILAKLLNNNFKMDDIVAQIETEVTKKTKGKINKYTKPKTEGKSLSDFF